MISVRSTLPLLFLLLAVCGPPPDDEADAPPAVAGTDGRWSARVLGEAASAPSGRIVVRTVHTGSPLPDTLPGSWDKTLGEQGAVPWVLVEVVEGLSPERTYGTPTLPVEMDQTDARFRPPVVALMTGQPLWVRNGDPTAHNVNVRGARNPGFNVTQRAGARPKVRTFPKPELGMPVKCDMHPWMRAWIHVLPHPYFTVTDAQGSGHIAHLPPGRYTLRTWHPLTAEARRAVEVTAGGEAVVTLSLRGRD